ncbi:MAG: FkbM family methyltransferase, partial [Chitinophagaceae bacterium]|nr:FkbM family methyltransferase [Rubrivivax sp.]
MNTHTAERSPTAERAATSAVQEPETWTLRLASGLVIHVPPSLRSLSTFVLLEQEQWFEPEMSLLPHLLVDGQGQAIHALDIGANHGVVALEMAQASGHGHVWAFEPTATPRAALERSVVANGFTSRITVVAAGLSDQAGSARFVVQDNSELNARDGNGPGGGRHETVQLCTLDSWLDGLGAAAPAIGFIKLDAEGDEVRVLAGGQRFFAQQSPVVLFELKHGAAVNHALLDAWQALGYDIFRWSAELALLRPFDAAGDELAFALNLVAVRPVQQAALVAR